MKLTPEHIAAIEDLINRRSTEKLHDICPVKTGGLDSRCSKMNSFFGVLRAIGVSMPKMARGNGDNLITGAELAEFRAWKASRTAQSEQQQ